MEITTTNSIVFSASDTDEEKAVIAALTQLLSIQLDGTQLKPIHEEASDTSIEFNALSYQELRETV